MVEARTGASVQVRTVRTKRDPAGKNHKERKPHETPSIGVLLCASKDDEVVEYSLNRSLSPALIAEYQVQLPDKQLLQAKLHEFYALNVAQAEES